MLEAIFWGLIQGLTEFLPISSSGHLVLVPALLGVDPPDLATTAVLHLGTLAAVLAYYRHDVIKLVHFRSDREARLILALLAIGTAPAGLAILLKDTVEGIQTSVTAVAVLLLITGVVLLISGILPKGTRRLEDGRWGDALAVGIAQVAAVFPGLSRSGLTITTGQARRFEGREAARFSFLLSVPVIAAAGLLEGLELSRGNGLTADVWVGLVVAAISGYGAIALVLRFVNRYGLRPFAFYCFGLGVLSLAVL